MLRDIVFAGWVRVWWRRWQWWWWRWQWLRLVVTVVVWGGTGLAVCRYWRVPLRPHAHPVGGDPVQYPYTFHKQVHGFKNYQASNDNADVPGHRIGNIRGGHHDSSTLSVINKSMSHTNQKYLVNILSPGSHSDHHHAHKAIHGIDNIVAKNPLPAKLNTRDEGGTRQTNKTHAIENVNYVGASGRVEVKENDDAPRVILLLTSWRSGSTFMGELLSSAVPETFYR